MTDRFQAWIGLGGNVGDVKSRMKTALEILDQTDGVELTDVSSIYMTPPWGKTDQDWFLNACAGLSTNLEPEALMDILLETEIRMKRVRQERWGPRTIDLDLLVYEGREVVSDKVTIPHPRMHERAFVLVPLLEIAADLEVFGKPLAQWLSRLDSSQIKVSAPKGWHLD